MAFPFLVLSYTTDRERRKPNRHRTSVPAASLMGRENTDPTAHRMTTGGMTVPDNFRCTTVSACCVSGRTREQTREKRRPRTDSIFLQTFHFSTGILFAQGRLPQETRSWESWMPSYRLWS